MKYLRIIPMVFCLISACAGDPCEDAAEIVERCLGGGTHTNGTTNGAVSLMVDFDGNQCRENAKEKAARCILDNEATICGSDSERAIAQVSACSER